MLAALYSTVSRVGACLASAWLQRGANCIEDARNARVKSLSVLKSILSITAQSEASAFLIYLMSLENQTGILYSKHMSHILALPWAPESDSLKKFLPRFSLKTTISLLPSLPWDFPQPIRSHPEATLRKTQKFLEYSSEVQRKLPANCTKHIAGAITETSPPVYLLQSPLQFSTKWFCLQMLSVLNGIVQGYNCSFSALAVQYYFLCDHTFATISIQIWWHYWVARFFGTLHVQWNSRFIFSKTCTQKTWFPRLQKKLFSRPSFLKIRRL